MIEQKGDKGCNSKDSSCWFKSDYDRVETTLQQLVFGETSTFKSDYDRVERGGIRVPTWIYTV